MSVAAAQPETTARPAGDRTGREFWNLWWQRTPLPERFDPFRGGLKSYPFRCFHRFFASLFRDAPPPGGRLIELGCAHSPFLPYFGRHFGFVVTGLDQSELGCEGARRLLECERVAGNVQVGDLFTPPAGLRGAFDVAFSSGVIEHFDDTAQAVRAVAEFVRPGGLTVAVIPNFTGALGRYQRLLDRELYEMHVALDQERLAQAHRDAGLKVISAGYLMPLSLEVMNVGRWRRRRAARWVDRAHTALSRLVWFADEHLIPLRPNGRTSPYVVCAARRPAPANLAAANPRHSDIV